nr:melanoma-associated antigen 4-like isoform X1 [Microcebus murinus]XP_020140699.1 melanoma-associated antigen 4-like isoform X1 [Microcebus murinus]
MGPHYPAPAHIPACFPPRAIMPRRHRHHHRSQHRRVQGGLRAQREAQRLVGAQSPGAEEEGAAASSSTVTPGTLEEVPAAATPSPPGSPQGASSSPTGLASNQGSSNQEEEGPSSSQDPASVQREALEEKISDLIHFLLLKYRIKELITKEEMLDIVIKDYQDHFAEIFREASDCMQLVFGVDVKEVDPAGQSYILVTSVGLTYYEELNDDQRFPKVGLLIIVLGLIFLEGDCAPEEVIWEGLGVMGVHAGMEHVMYGEPRKLVTQDWVREGYLEYRQVANSDPACYEFLWGPRAHAETSKLKVLEYVAKVNGCDPRSFPLLYEEALRDEEEGM